MNNDTTEKSNKAEEAQTHELLDEELKIIFLKRLSERTKIMIPDELG